MSCGEKPKIEDRRARLVVPEAGSDLNVAPTVFASNYPLAYFAERISGSADHVVFPDIDGDPAFWNPSAENVASMQAASVILLNGATYERWLDGVTLPERKIVDTSAPFADRHLRIAGAISHSHGPGAEHAHAGTAFTTWLDFSLAAEQATSVYQALGDAGIGSESERDSNYAALIVDLNAIDSDIATLTEGQSSVPLVASHPVYQYLADRYGLNIESVLWEPEIYPDQHQWELLSDLLERHPARWMIWEGEPAVESVERLREMGLESIVFDPAGNRPESGDFVTAMRRNVENLTKVFQ